MRFDEFHTRGATPDTTDGATERIIGAAIEVYREMGPGLTEVMYEAALCREFELRRTKYARQAPVAVSYKGVVVGEARIDLVVERQVIVELKACEGLNPAHRSQCITYLRATGLRLALLINFNVPVVRDSIKRVILSH